MIYKRVKFNYIYVVIALVLLTLSVMGGRYISSAFADTPQYTNALTDLQKDSEFNVADYPDNAKDYSIRFIQIAESTDKELFVYTYQPSQKTTYLVATEINMSLSDTADGTQLYGLTLINSDGVFCKYKVNGVTVSSDVVRYYNITSIYRDWMKGIDKETGNDNTKNAVAFEVGKLYAVITDDGGNVIYNCEIRTTVQIIDPFAGFLEYFTGFKFCSWAHCHSHYVAFSTDRKIDELMEADVSYLSQACYKHYSMTSGVWFTRDEPIEGFKTVKGTEVGETDDYGIKGKKYKWDRIQTVDEFISTEDLTEATKANLDGKQWVLRFLETEYIEDSIGIASSDTWTELSSVTVLRLKFITDGQVYNLGAVSDKVSEGNKPGNNNTDEVVSIWEWLERKTGVPQWVWTLLAVLIPIAIILPILSFIFPIVGTVILAALKGLWRLISLPFRGIVALVRKIRARRE